MTKKNNIVDILVTDDITKSSKKMELATELKVEIMSYQDLIDLFDLDGDL
jgi:hypothetical protein